MAEDLAADPDRHLAEKLRYGDQRAFAEVVGRYHGRLLGLVRPHVPDRETAEDVVQEAWLGALRGIDRFESRCVFRTWLFRIAINQARTWITRTRRRRRALEGLKRELPTAVRMSPRTPEQLLLAMETCVTADEILDSLSPNQRAVLAMQVEGLDGGEVCGLLGIGASNQRVLLHRARLKLRRECW